MWYKNNNTLVKYNTAINQYFIIKKHINFGFSNIESTWKNSNNIFFLYRNVKLSNVIYTKTTHITLYLKYFNIHYQISFVYLLYNFIGLTVAWKTLFFNANTVVMDKHLTHCYSRNNFCIPKRDFCRMCCRSRSEIQFRLFNAVCISFRCDCDSVRYWIWRH